MLAALLVALALFVIVKVMRRFGWQIVGCLLILLACLTVLGSCSAGLLGFS